MDRRQALGKQTNDRPHKIDRGSHYPKTTTIWSVALKLKAGKGCNFINANKMNKASRSNTK